VLARSKATSVITGASSGIGLETARTLAAAGHHIVMVVRNQAKAQAAADEIRTATPGAQVDIVTADLYVMDEVRLAAAEIKKRFEVDVLVNNAGLIHDKRELTTDGFERTFALNHLAAFLLTHELRDHIREGGRVVTVSSNGHRYAWFKWDDLATMQRWPGGILVYGASKLCNIWFAREASRRLAARKITSNSLHPGAVASNFGASGSIVMRVGTRLARPLLLTAAEGARTSVYLASSPEVEGVTGEYFVKCNVARPTRQARDDDAASRLWELSEQLTGVTWR
jgi:NAD(P)-dependent dehydrogenase (short-subunit alcohol dehydrogenase family)